MNIQNITQPFIKQFSGDLSLDARQRQTPGFLYALVKPMDFPNSSLLHFNSNLSNEIGMGELDGDFDFLSAQNLPTNVATYATAYAGHQFGNWAGQLGDGRAIFAGEISNANAKSTELQWKGVGATPYSRHADGRAVLRSSIREYLMSEAMYHLGVPTTRALSLSLSGEMVVRDMMYDGNPEYEKGAIVMRTAPSFLRFGHFELLASRGEIDELKKLCDYTIAMYFPEIQSEGKEKYVAWIKDVSKKTADLICEWMRVGFVHGVLNTDNMSILGLGIDYGPYSMLDQYDLNFTSNTTDLPGRRYAFGKQGQIAQWNLWQLVNAVFPIIEDERALQDILNDFSGYFWKQYDSMMLRKLGIDELHNGDEDLITELTGILQDLQFDYTLFFTELERYRVDANFQWIWDEISYKRISDSDIERFNAFLNAYKERLEKNEISKEVSLSLMQKSNPKFTLRNYLLFQCIEEVNSGDMTLFAKLWEALQNPYQELYPEFSKKRPFGFDDQPGCSTLSCSS